jgi:phosphoglycerate dehydrogenase-like enzyme
MKLVIYPPVESERLNRIVAAAGPMRVVNAESEQEALEAIRDADAFFGKITPPLLAAAKQLRWVQSPTASLEHYLFPELIAHPCVLTNMRGIFSGAIAEQVMGYLICFTRNLHLYARRQIERRWEPVGGEAGRNTFDVGPGVVSTIDIAHQELHRATAGIIGLGHIGETVAKRVAAFGMRVLAIDPLRTEKPAEVESLWSLDRLPELLAESDYVIIAAPHTPQTEKMFRRAQFERMKHTARLINVGRGAIVDLDDLTAALQGHKIAGAALDVFEIEPLPADHPLWGFENVIITPHVGGFSPETPARHLAVLLENVHRFAHGEGLLNVVNKQAWF